MELRVATWIARAVSGVCLVGLGLQLHWGTQLRVAKCVALFGAILDPGPRILPHLFNLVRSCQLWQIHLSQLLVPLLLAAQKDIDAAKRHPKYPKSASRTETQRRACELQDVDSPDE